MTSSSFNAVTAKLVNLFLLSLKQILCGFWTPYSDHQVTRMLYKLVFDQFLLGVLADGSFSMTYKSG